MLSPYGLSSIHQCLTGVYDYGVPVSAVVDTNQTGLSVETEPTDLGLRALKTIQCVELDVIGSGYNMSYKIGASLNSVDIELENLPVNPMGVCTNKMSGLSFTVGIHNDSYADKVLNGMMVRYKLTDKRFLRGPYDYQASTRASS